MGDGGIDLQVIRIAYGKCSGKGEMTKERYRREPPARFHPVPEIGDEADLADVKMVG